MEYRLFILDEAHHLRTEWYATLIDICKNLKMKFFELYL